MSDLIVISIVIVCLISKTGLCYNSYKKSINSESEDYDKIYRELELEYESELSHFKTTGEEIKLTTSQPPWAEEYEEIVRELNITDENSIELGVRERSYEEQIIELSCQNPWFWNSFKCTWLDISNKNVVKRTRKNGKVAGILLGGMILLIVAPICWICILKAYFSSRVKKFSKMIDDYTTEYAPGKIKLKNGEIKKYTPTQKEEEAFNNLIQVLTSVV